jgi:Spy/CpxP family protein refolding chaperone
LKTEHRERVEAEDVMKKLLMLVLVVAAAGPLFAAEFDLPPGKWWENERLVEHIGLSDEQQEQIGDVVYAHARTMIDLKANVERAGLDLAEVVDRQAFEPDAVRAAYSKFQDARKKLENERFEMLLAVRQVITYEQWQQLQSLRKRMQDQRGQRRPGMQSPPGGRQRPEGRQQAPAGQRY